MIKHRIFSIVAAVVLLTSAVGVPVAFAEEPPDGTKENLAGVLRHELVPDDDGPNVNIGTMGHIMSPTSEEFSIDATDWVALDSFLLWLLGPF